MQSIDAAARRSLSRRHFLKTAGFGTALLAPAFMAAVKVPGNAAGAPAMDMSGHALVPLGVPRAPYDKNGLLVEPEVRRSVNGELQTSLRVAYAYKDIGGYRLSLRSYEGNIPGPTLRLRPGDVLRIRLVNALPPNADPAPLDMMLPHHFNTTNFHLHGLHVSPDGISDNIFRSMEPGQSYDIEVVIPKDHTRGTYWYHPHH